MRIITHSTEIEGTEQLNLILLNDNSIELEMSSHPLEGREVMSIVLSKEGVLELIEDLEKLLNKK